MATDPAFLFYPAEASEDTQHMNRLERGCYFDILKAQKKFGSFTLDQIKKVLGKDFETCWQALELVLSCDNGRFFIQWAFESIEKRKKFSKTQKERIEKRWNNRNDTGELPETNHGITTVLPVNNGGMGLEIPLGNTNGNGIENEEGGAGGENGIRELGNLGIGQMPPNGLMDVDLLKEKVLLDREFKREFEQQGLPPDKLEKWMENFNKFLRHCGIAEKTEKDYRWHFGNWLKKQMPLPNPENYSPLQNFANGRTQNNSKTFTRTPAGAISGNGGY